MIISDQDLLCACCCCTDKCERVIDRIEVDVIFNDDDVTTYTFPVGKTFAQAKCFIPMHIGNTTPARVYQPGSSGGCIEADGSVQDFKVTFTGLAESIRFACGSRWAMVQASQLDATYEYYWQDERYVFGVGSFVFAFCYQGKTISAALGQCPTDAEAAITIRDALRAISPLCTIASGTVSGQTGTLVFSSPSNHRMSVNDTIVISGCSVAGWNGRLTVTQVLSLTSVRVRFNGTPPGNCSDGTATLFPEVAGVTVSVERNDKPATGSNIATKSKSCESIYRDRSGLISPFYEMVTTLNSTEQRTTVGIYATMTASGFSAVVTYIGSRTRTGTRQDFTEDGTLAFSSAISGCGSNNSPMMGSYVLNGYSGGASLITPRPIDRDAAALCCSGDTIPSDTETAESYVQCAYFGGQVIDDQTRDSSGNTSLTTPPYTVRQEGTNQCDKQFLGPMLQFRVYNQSSPVDASCVGNAIERVSTKADKSVLGSPTLVKFKDFNIAIGSLAFTLSASAAIESGAAFDGRGSLDSWPSDLQVPYINDSPFSSGSPIGGPLQWQRDPFNSKLSWFLSGCYYEGNARTTTAAVSPFLYAPASVDGSQLYLPAMSVNRLGASASVSAPMTRRVRSQYLALRCGFRTDIGGSCSPPSTTSIAAIGVVSIGKLYIDIRRTLPTLLVPETMECRFRMDYGFYGYDASAGTFCGAGYSGGGPRSSSFSAALQTSWFRFDDDVSRIYQSRAFAGTVKIWQGGFTAFGAGTVPLTDVTATITPVSP